MAQLSLEERLHRTITGDAAIIASLAKAVSEAYGEEGLEVLRGAMERTFRPIMATLAKQVGARLGDGDVSDWAKLERFLCQVTGIEGDIVEVSPNKGMVKVSFCPAAAQYKRVFPDLCPQVFIGLERAIAGAVNPRLRVRGEKYIPRGDEICEIHCELEEG
ncbi:MAG: L-2-amino-thiazoline-4-carboxylic acid hydrolase [Dehalococcoidia bacterium]